MPLLGDLMQDSRYALRVLLKTPGTTGIAILALALGIGVNASSFVSINALFLRPFPFPDLDRIVMVSETGKSGGEQGPLSPANFSDVVRGSRSLASAAAYRGWQVSYSGAENPERVQGVQVSGSFFDVLGMRAEFGRTLTRREVDAGAPDVVISRSFWKSHLGGARAAVGQALVLGGRSYRIAGIMPDEFDYPLGTAVWAPLHLSAREEQERGARSLMMLARLQRGTTVSRAASELEAMARELARRFPASGEGRAFRVELLRDARNAPTSRFIAMLLGASGFVLLLACANIGNLQLARAAARQKEISVRFAVGASRGAIARQLVVESVLISLAAGLAGLLLASWNNALMKSDTPPIAMRIVPGLRTMHLDGWVVVYTLGVSLLAGVLCSLPAIVQLTGSARRRDLTEALRERSGALSSAVQRSRFRSALIVFELALALVLLVGAGLMVETFNRLLERDQGFSAKNVLLVPFSLPPSGVEEAARVAVYDRLLERAASGEGVRSASISAPAGSAGQLRMEGRPEPRPGEPRPLIVAISSGYFQTLRIPILEGRSVTEADRAGSARVAVISQNFARHYWSHGSAVGRRMQMNAREGWVTIVGVSRDVLEDWFTGTPSYFAYVPYTQAPPVAGTLRLRGTGDPLQLASFAWASVRHAERDIAVGEVEAMTAALANERAGVRAAARSMTTYAVIALLLAATGIYAVLSFFVAARRHDIGVRMALGADRADVLKMTLGQAVRLAAVGLLIGVPLAVVLSRVMASVLYGIVAIDPLTFLIFGTVLVAAALLASYVPAYRATRIDPLTALRDE